MEIASLQKSIKIIVDPINGTIDYEIEGHITFSEILGSMEYVKMMVMKEWLEETVE